jgi:hypothetical protein
VQCRSGRAGFLEKRWRAASAAAVAQGVFLEDGRTDGRIDAAAAGSDDHSSGSLLRSSSSLTSNGYRDMICLLCLQSLLLSLSLSPCQGPPLGAAQTRSTTSPRAPPLPAAGACGDRGESCAKVQLLLLTSRVCLYIHLDSTFLFFFFASKSMLFFLYIQRGGSARLLCLLPLLRMGTDTERPREKEESQ